MNIKDVPIIYYHSVGNDSCHPWSDLSLPTSVFEKQLRYLKKNGFTTYTIAELHELASDIPKKSIVLTFDDGYLDNWIFAYPLLKKYGAKATFFVNPEFVDTDATIRPTLEEVWNGSVSQDDLATWGYASWQELKKMSDEGSVNIESHGMTHASYFSGEKLIDFHHPKDPYYWLEWNLRPEKKPFWFAENFADDMAYGYPIYEFGMGLVTRRYSDDQSLAERLTDYVKVNGGRDFFKNDDSKGILKALYHEHIKDNPLRDRIETKKEYLSRVKSELVESKREIEKNIGKPVRFFCWPNGGYNEEVHRIAVEDVGYLATVAVEKEPQPARSDLLGRVSFGQSYQGPCRKSFYYLKFISAVESLAGAGMRHNLIRFYQRTKVSSLYHWFLRRFFRWQ